MEIVKSEITLLDYHKPFVKLVLKGDLKGDKSEDLRREVNGILELDVTGIYLQMDEVNEIDLAGANELIHTHYLLNRSNKKLVVVCPKGSEVQKWMEITGANKFISLALLPKKETA